MLNGLFFSSKDKVWTKILGELGAIVTKDEKIADFIFTPPNKKLSPLELKAEVLQQIDAKKATLIQSIFGKKNPEMSDTQEKIIMLLYKHGGLSIKQLNEYLGYSANTKTHTADTAIYQLRKNFGAKLIKQTDGIYTLGKL